MLSCSKLEHDDMASDNHGDQRAVSRGETVKDLRAVTRPSPPSNPPSLNNGLELPRSSHC
jgi:hypothetical protein